MGPQVERSIVEEINELPTGIRPKQCGSTDETHEPLVPWWILAVLVVSVLSVLLGISFKYPQRFPIFVVGYTSIMAGVTFHLYANAFAVFSMGVSLRDDDLILTGKEILANALTIGLGTGTLFLAATVWVADRDGVIGGTVAGLLHPDIGSISILLARLVDGIFLFGSLRFLIVIGHFFLLIGLVRHNFCWRWFIDVAAAVEEHKGDDGRSGYYLT
jgi:hypothetical protein